jgi:hypothetical protein
MNLNNHKILRHHALLEYLDNYDFWEIIIVVESVNLTDRVEMLLEFFFKQNLYFYDKKIVQEILNVWLDYS